MLETQEDVDMPPRGYPQHFKSGNAVRFPRPLLSESDAEWWNTAVRRETGVYPDELPAFLASGIDADISGDFTAFDAGAGMFALDLYLHDKTTRSRIAFKSKRFEVKGELINSGETRVHPDWQEKGIGTALMINLIDFAGHIETKRIDIEAQDIGRYAWLPMGFLPDKTSWKEKLIPKLRSFADLAFGLGRVTDEIRGKVYDITSDTDPRAARELLGLNVDVPGLDRMNRPAEISLPKAMLLQPGTDWNGSFELDEDTLDFFKVYRSARDGHDRQAG